MIGWALSILFVSLPFPPALASLFLVLNVNEAHAGSVVSGVTKGKGAVTVAAASNLRLFFIPESMDSASVDRGDGGLVPAGQLSVGRSGSGTARILVPDVPVGRYTVLVLCPKCAADSGGRELLPVANFMVTPSPYATGKRLPWLIMWVAVILLLGVGAMLLKRSLAP
jgi:hypothetical protein